MSSITLDDTITLGDRPVRRFGFGAMRITGDGIWGPPEDHDEAIAVLRRAGELGINLIDTANSYGPDVSEDLIAEALYPYPDDLVIATKGGLVRPGPNVWNRTAGPSTCARSARAACGASSSSASTSISCIVPTPTCPWRTPSAPW